MTDADYFYGAGGWYEFVGIAMEQFVGIETFGCFVVSVFWLVAKQIMFRYVSRNN